MLSDIRRLLSVILVTMEAQMKFFEKVLFPFRLAAFQKSENTESESVDNASKNEEVITVPENRRFNFQRLNSTGRVPDINSSNSKPRDLMPIPSNMKFFLSDGGPIGNSSFIHDGSRYRAGTTDNKFVTPRNDTSFQPALSPGKQGSYPQSVRDSIYADKPATAVPPEIVDMQGPDGEIIAPSRGEAFGRYAIGGIGGNIGEERTLFGPYGNWGEDGLGPEADGYMPGDTPPTKAEILARILQREYANREISRLSEGQEGPNVDAGFNSDVPLSDLARTAQFYAQRYQDTPKNSRWKLREMMQLPEDRSEQSEWHALRTQEGTDESGKPYDLGEISEGTSYTQDIADMIEAHLRATGNWPEGRVNNIVEAYAPERGVSTNFLNQQQARTAAANLSDFDSGDPDPKDVEQEDPILSALEAQTEDQRDALMSAVPTRVLFERLLESAYDDKNKKRNSLDEFTRDQIDIKDATYAELRKRGEMPVMKFPETVHDFMNAILLHQKGESPAPPSRTIIYPRPTEETDAIGARAERAQMGQPPTPAQLSAITRMATALNRVVSVEGLDRLAASKLITSLNQDRINDVRPVTPPVTPSIDVVPTGPAVPAGPKGLYDLNYIKHVLRKEANGRVLTAEEKELLEIAGRHSATARFILKTRDELDKENASRAAEKSRVAGQYAAIFAEAGLDSPPIDRKYLIRLCEKLWNHETQNRGPLTVEEQKDYDAAKQHPVTQSEVIEINRALHSPVRGLGGISRERPTPDEVKEFEQMHGPQPRVGSKPGMYPRVYIDSLLGKVARGEPITDDERQILIDEGRWSDMRSLEMRARPSRFSPSSVSPSVSPSVPPSIDNVSNWVDTFDDASLNSLNADQMSALMDSILSGDTTEQADANPVDDFPPEEEGKSWVFNDDGEKVKLHANE